MTDNDNIIEDNQADETSDDDEVTDLMENYDLDEDTAEKAQELIDEGLDEEDAVELAGEL